MIREALHRGVTGAVLVCGAFTLAACAPDGSGAGSDGRPGAMAAAASAPAPSAVVTPVLSALDLATDSAAYLAVLAAEDRRAPDDADLETLRAAVRSGLAGSAGSAGSVSSAGSAGLRRAAVRAIGRLERPGLAADLFEVMASDPAPDARAEAANAMAQAVRAGSDGERAAAVGLLLERFDAEPEPGVVAAIARSLGRIPPADAVQAALVARALADHARRAGAAPAVRLGIARGVYAYVRLSARRSAATADADVDTLFAAALDALLGDADPAVRRTALVARRAVSVAPEPPLVRRLAADADPGVRRELVGWAASSGGSAGEAAWRRETVRAALDDAAPEVRVAAVQGWGTERKASEGCAPLIAAATNEAGRSDPGDAVALAAIDALGDGCPDRVEVEAALSALAGALASDPARWHRPARALVALSRVAPAAAAALLPDFVGHPSAFVRADAARAAGVVAVTAGPAAADALAILAALAADPDANVREAALRAAGPRTPTATLVDQLARDEPQLLRTVAQLLEGRAGPGVEVALFDALDRVSHEDDATARDARLALITRIGEIGAASDGHARASLVDRLRRYLRDFDPLVADAAAAVLTEWTGTAAAPAPSGIPRLPLPGFAELAALEDSTVILTMANGEGIEIALLPFEAPTNAWRFARMARERRFDGLTWHRVVPNFVVQGGSPGANEYAGHGAFTRDEVGLVGHWAGTLGVSTRGRDTGDGQPFFNLVDNLRLDHDYTVFAYVTRGFDVVRRIRTGDVIESVRLVARR